MNSDNLKKLAAQAALQYIQPNMIVGIGSGTTVGFFIEALQALAGQIETTVASSEKSAALLKQYHLSVTDLNSVDNIDVYVDGADEINHHLQMIKGGGGALTREKIIASTAKQFICIADESKYVQNLGRFPLPIEVIPMARSQIARQLVKLGGSPVYREGFVTDNGNHIIDVHQLQILEPIALDEKLNQIPGIVCHGIFAHQHANTLLLSQQDGKVKVLQRDSH